MPPYTLNRLKRFLKKQAYAFYNHPKLLSDIREAYWMSIDEEETRINTDVNSGYRYCRILHRMKHKRQKTKEEEGTQRDETGCYIAQKVRFIEIARTIEDTTNSNKKEKDTVLKPILKRSLSTSEDILSTACTETQREKHTVYITCKSTGTQGLEFKYAQ